MATRARALSPNDGRSVRASKKRESRRKAILQAARRAFAEKGYHHTHVADIIAGAGIARGTFYLYFESKNAIFLELLDQLLDELQASIVGLAGFYLGRRGIMNKAGAKLLSSMSVKVTIPCLLFMVSLSHLIMCCSFLKLR